MFFSIFLDVLVSLVSTLVSIWGQSSSIVSSRLVSLLLCDPHLWVKNSSILLRFLSYLGHLSGGVWNIEVMIYLHPKAVSQFTWPWAPEAGMAGLVLPSPPPPGLLTLLRPGSSSSPPPLPLLLFHLSSSSSFSSSCSFLSSVKPLNHFC